MATYRLSAPNGSEYDLEMPDTASPGDVQTAASAALKQMGHAPAADVAETTPPDRESGLTLSDLVTGRQPAAPTGIGENLRIGTGKLLRGSVGSLVDLANLPLQLAGVPGSEKPTLGRQSLTELFGIPEDTTLGQRALTGAIEVSGGWLAGIPVAGLVGGTASAARMAEDMVKLAPLAGVAGALAKEPVRGTALEPVADITGQVLSIVATKSIGSMRNIPAVEEGLGKLASAMHTTKEIIAGRYPVLPALQAGLRKMGLDMGAIQPWEVLNEGEYDATFGAKYAGTNKVTPEDVGTAITKLQQPPTGRTTSEIPWEQPPTGPQQISDMLPLNRASGQPASQGLVTPNLPAAPRTPMELLNERQAPQPPVAPAPSPTAKSVAPPPINFTTVESVPPATLVRGTPDESIAAASDAQLAQQVAQDSLDKSRAKFVRYKQKKRAAPAAQAMDEEPPVGGGGPPIYPTTIGAEDSPELRVVLEEAMKGGSWFSQVGLPVNMFPDSRWHGWWASMNTKYRIGDTLREQLAKDVTELTKLFKTPEQNKALSEAIATYVLRPDGTYLQTNITTPPNVQQAVEKFRKVTDRLFYWVTGIKAQAVPIVRSMGLDDGADLWTQLREIQLRPDLFVSESVAQSTGDPARLQQMGLTIVPDAHFDAAEATNGMLHFDFRPPETQAQQGWHGPPTHDIRPRYQQGYFSHMAIPNEMAVLQNEMEDIQQKLAEMGLGPQERASMEDALKLKQERLSKLQQRMTEQEKRDAPSIENPERYRWAANWLMQQDPDAAEWGWDTDVERVGHKLIHTGIHKGFMDHTLNTARDIIPLVKKDSTSHQYFMKYLSYLRGVRGYGEDQTAAKTANAVVKYAQRLTGKAPSDVVTPKMIKDNVNRLIRFSVMTDLNMSPRFAIVNRTQTWTTVMPLVPWSTYVRAEMRANKAMAYEALVPMVGEEQARAQTGDGYHWYRLAKGAGAFSSQSGGQHEDVPVVPGLFEKVTDVMAIPAGLTENANRVAAFLAGFEDALHKEAHPYIRRFMDPKRAGPHGTRAYALQAGRAMVDATQMIQKQHGRPLLMAGGSLRQAATLYRPYQTGMGGIIKGLVDEGDWEGLAKMMGALWLVGGGRAVLSMAGGGTLWDWARREALEQGFTEWPNRTGLGYATEWAGFGEAPAMDVSGSMDVISTPNGFVDVGGAIATKMYGTGKAVIQSMMPQQPTDDLQARPLIPAEAQHTFLDALFRPVMNVGLGLQELQTGQGGQDPKTGEPLRLGKPMQAMALAVGLARRPAAILNEDLKDLRSAIRGEKKRGSEDQVEKIIARIEAKGFKVPLNFKVHVEQAMQRKYKGKNAVIQSGPFYDLLPWSR